MNKIGYAVFGRPKGITVISNGIFKELNFEKSLYLNNAHIILDKGEQVLMFRRIPTNIQNLERKDGLLVALYEHALQYGENRPGGFVGSAICFKDNLPNAEKMISGLTYLFSKMKENVDENNRFKSINNTSWNINLPDANKEFGMFEKEHLSYVPLSNAKENFVIKVNHVEKDAIALLSHLCLNHSYHNTNYVYASNSSNVIKKLVSNNLNLLEYSSLFNYTKHLDYYKNKISTDIAALSKIKTEAKELQNHIKREKDEFDTLVNKIYSRKNDLSEIEKEIGIAKDDCTKAKEKKQEVQRELNELKRLGRKNSPNISNFSQEDRNEIKGYKELIKDAAKIIDNHTSVKFYDRVTNEQKVISYFEKLPDRKRRNKKYLKFMFSIFLILFLTFLGLFIYKNFQFISVNEKLVTSSGQNIRILKQTKQEDSIKNMNKELFVKILLYEKSSKKADYKKFGQYSEIFLNNFLDEVYKKGSSELVFIENYKWEFWEFDYTNGALVEKLNVNSKNYFVNLTKEIKKLQPSLTWENEGNLSRYLDEPNDIYHNIDKGLFENLKKEGIVDAHFKWVVEKNNGDIAKLEEGKKINVPYFKVE